MSKDTHKFRFFCGVVYFEKTTPFVYSIRTELGGTGSDATNCVRQAIRKLFEQTDALVIQAEILHSNKASKVVANTVGLLEFRRDSKFSFRRLTIGRWLKTNESPIAEKKRPKNAVR